MNNNASFSESEREIFDEKEKISMPLANKKKEEHLQTACVTHTHKHTYT